MKTERKKENTYNNYNTNKEKKKENKIPFNATKKRNSLNERTFKKKIPFNNGNKNNIINVNLNESKNIGNHKKNTSYNPEISGIFSVRPKSTKQISHTKNNSNNKVEVNCSNNLKNNRNNNGNSNDYLNNKEISISKTTRLNN